MAKAPAKLDAAVVNATLQEMIDARKASHAAGRALSKAQDRARAADQRQHNADDAWRRLALDKIHGKSPRFT